MSHWRFMVRYDPKPGEMPYADDTLFVVSEQAWLNDKNDDNEHYVYAVTSKDSLTAYLERGKVVRICQFCRLPVEDHAKNKKCLFGSTTYKRWGPK